MLGEDWLTLPAARPLAVVVWVEAGRAVVAGLADPPMEEPALVLAELAVVDEKELPRALTTATLAVPMRVVPSEGRVATETMVPEDVEIGDDVVVVANV